MPRLLTPATALALAACGGSSAPPDAPTDPWSSGAPLPLARLHPGVTAIGDSLVVLGGATDAAGTPTTEVDVLDTTLPDAEQAWSTLPAAPRGWTGAQLASSGALLYALGGASADGTLDGSAFVLDTADASPAWTALASLPPGLERAGAAVVVASPRIYLLGGTGAAGALASNLFYDSIMDAWCPGPACTTVQSLPDLPAPRAHPAAIRRSDGTLVVAGGFASADTTQPAADTWWLTVDQQVGSGAWTPKTPMPTARGDCAFGSAGGRLVCAGGDAGAGPLAVTEIYEPGLDPTPPSAGAWTTLPSLPSPRAGTPGATIGQRLFVPGGAADAADAPLATLFVLDLLDTADDGN